MRLESALIPASSPGRRSGNRTFLFCGRSSDKSSCVNFKATVNVKALSLGRGLGEGGSAIQNAKKILGTTDARKNLPLDWTSDRGGQAHHITSNTGHLRERKTV